MVVAHAPSLIPPPSSLLPRTTPRQKEVLELLCRGLDNNAISLSLGISPRTIKHYLGGIYRQYGIYGRPKRIKLLLAVLPPLELADITLPHFSPKERTILDLVASGVDTSDIADALTTSTQCVKNYLRSIFDKTGTSSRLELTLWYLRTDIRHSAATGPCR